MANPQTPSERDFEEYLAAHGYLADHDVDWRALFAVSTEKQPDYLVSRAREKLAICEVKEFTTTKVDRRLALGGYSSSSGAELYGEAADAIQAACQQLRPFASVGLPLVAVLANPHGRMVDLGPYGLTFSLFGRTDAVQIPVGPAGQVGNARLIATGLGALSAVDQTGEAYNPHPYLSAIVVVRVRTNEQDFVEAELARRRPNRPARTDAERVARAVANYEALSAAGREGQVPPGQYQSATVFDLRAQSDFTATPLPPNIFDGPRDRWYEIGPGGLFTERASDTTAA